LKKNQLVNIFYLNYKRAILSDVNSTEEERYYTLKGGIKSRYSKRKVFDVIYNGSQKDLKLFCEHYDEKYEADGINKNDPKPRNPDDEYFDKIMLIVKDENGKKHSQIIERPVFNFYMTSDPKDRETYYNYISRDKVDLHKCYYKDLFYEIKDSSDEGNKRIREMFEVFKDKQLSNSEGERNVHNLPYLHGTDMNIQDHYIHKYYLKYNPEENFVSLTKAFFDIEVDSSKLRGFPDPIEAEAPVNIITLVNQETMQVFVLILKYEHQGYLDTMNKLDKIKQRLKEKYKSKKVLDNVEYIFEEFDTELELLKRFFYLINEELRPDICVAWNISFDFVTIYHRLLKLLGEDMNSSKEHPKLDEIMCPKDFKYKCAYYRLDTKHSDPAERSDIYNVTSYTAYIDLMCLYANITKPIGKKESYSLDAIAEEEVGIKKDEYDGSIKTLHYDDYETFLFYNINDSLLLFLIEDKTKHLDLLYNISTMTHTRIDKSLKKTVCLRNFAQQFYEKNNFVISNNRSSLFERPDSKIKGAFVADPNNIAPIGKQMNFGKSDKIFDLATDMDFSALYPSIIECFNIAPDAIDTKLYYMKKNKDTKEFEDITSEFMDDLLSRDAINFCMKYYNFPSPNEIFDLIESEN